jgi:hypothetical protein
MEAARVHADLTVQDLWLRYVALGGTDDAFDIDGYLQGLIPIDIFQQDVLAQALNEALDDRYRALHIPLSSPAPGVGDEADLHSLVRRLLHPEPHPGKDRQPPPGDGT